MKPVFFSRYTIICNEVEWTYHPKPLINKEGEQVIQEPIVLTKLEPRVIIVRNRSKYLPHQGQKEKARRGQTNTTQPIV